jgi:ADP-ribose pyrophosphatase YjhB (NUDIX family)
LIHNNNLLLIKRAKGDFANLLGLLGGKIELNEHIGQAAEREILEESGIEARFEAHLGVVSEHIIENGVIAKHLILHVCQLSALTTDILVGQEGVVAWYDLSDLSELKSAIIPSDFLMIEKYVVRKEQGYCESVIELTDGVYKLTAFR